MHSIAGKVEKFIATILNQAREHRIGRTRSYDAFRRSQKISERESFNVVVHAGFLTAVRIELASSALTSILSQGKGSKKQTGNILYQQTGHMVLHGVNALAF
jgi:hypothetical protein